MSKYQSIIFDMNGVIVDDEPIHVLTDIETCETFGLNVPSTEWPKVKGWKVEEIFKKFAELYGQAPIDVGQMVAYKTAAYLKITESKLEPIPGALKFIELSRQLFPKVGLATSTLKVLQEFVFKKFNLASFFDVVITAEDLSKGKPDPEAYLLTAKKLGVKPENCLVIEDSINGVVAGKRAGCTVLAVTTSYNQEQLKLAGADYVFDNFQEVINNQNVWL